MPASPSTDRARQHLRAGLVSLVGHVGLLLLLVWMGSFSPRALRTPRDPSPANDSIVWLEPASDDRPPPLPPPTEPTLTPPTSASEGSASPSEETKTPSVPKLQARPSLPSNDAPPPPTPPASDRLPTEKLPPQAGDPTEPQATPAVSGLLSLRSNREARQPAPTSAGEGAMPSAAPARVVDLAPRVEGQVAAASAPFAREPEPPKGPEVINATGQTYILTPQSDGTLVYRAPDRLFKAVIHPNGEVSYNDGTHFYMGKVCFWYFCPYKLKRGSALGLAATLDAGELARENVFIEGLERSKTLTHKRLTAKQPPTVARFAMGYRTQREMEEAKRLFAKATENLRLQLFIGAQRDTMIAGLDTVERELDMIWRQQANDVRKKEILERLDYIDVALADIATDRADPPRLLAHRAWMKQHLQLYRLKLKRFICEHAQPAESNGFTGDEVKVCHP